MLSSASEWGDMEAFLWKGRLRIIAQGKKCSIRLEDSTTGKGVEINTEKVPSLDPNLIDYPLILRRSICIVSI